MSNIPEEEVKKQIEKEEVYFNPDSSTGMNHQVRVVAQNNSQIYLTKKLNKEINELTKTLNIFRSEMKNYQNSTEKQTNEIKILTITMFVVALLQLILLVIQIYLQFFRM